VVQATYFQLWSPRFDQAVYVDRLPVWDGTDYCDSDTGEVLPTWKQARHLADTDPKHQLKPVIQTGATVMDQTVMDQLFGREAGAREPPSLSRS
jgi:hypothetical protein